VGRRSNSCQPGRGKHLDVKAFWSYACGQDQEQSCGQGRASTRLPAGGCICGAATATRRIGWSLCAVAVDDLANCDSGASQRDIRGLTIIGARCRVASCHRTRGSRHPARAPRGQCGAHLVTADARHPGRPRSALAQRSLVSGRTKITKTTRFVPLLSRPLVRSSPCRVDGLGC